MKKVMAGIVTYNPSIDVFGQCVEAIYYQVDKVVIIDNASAQEIEPVLEKYENIEIIRNSTNQGIAKALSDLMYYANRYGYEWVLTLDQDTIVVHNLIEKYTQFMELPNIGAISCLINDRNMGVEITKERKEYWTVVDCITAGCMMNVDAYNHTNGYDNWMFIDKVDFDICYALRNRGYFIYKINFEGISHEVGKGKLIHFLFKSYKIMNHEPWRRYYMTRNGIYVARKYNKLVSFKRKVMNEIRDIILVFIFEDRKIEKLWKSVIGLYDGFTMELTISDK